MKRAKFLSGILAVSMLLGSVQMPVMAAEDSMSEEGMINETNENAADLKPVISPGSDAVTITADNNCVYITPEETGGYALQLSSSDDVNGCISCEYYGTDMGEGWFYVEDYYFSSEYYPDENVYILDQELICYLEAGITYRFQAEFYDNVDAAVSVTLQTSDKTGVIDGMRYRVYGEHAYIKDYTGTDSEVIIPSKINGYAVYGIGEYAFSSNTYIEKVYIQEGITHIESGAFQYCPNLKYIAFPSTLKSISGNPFGECEIETIELADGSNGVEDGAFIWGNGLVSFFDWSITEYTVPDGVKYIGDSAFDRTNIEGAELKTVILPESVVSIESKAFTCDAMQRDFGVADVYIKNAYCEIASDSFQKAYDYTLGEARYAVTIHAPSGGTVEQFCQEQGIPFAADGEAQKYFPLKENEISTIYRYIDGKFYGIFTPDRTSEYHFLPWQVDFSNVTVIDREGNTVEPSGKSLVYDYLSTYYLQEGEEYTIIVDGDMQGNIIGVVAAEESSEERTGTCGENLTWELTEEGTLIISGTGAMENWSCMEDRPWNSMSSRISSVVIGDGVTSIGDYAFFSLNGYYEEMETVHYSGLTDIVIPDSVTSIGKAAFGNCNDLTSITFGKGVTDIGEYAFGGCDGLLSVTIPDSVISIGSSAFEGCPLSEVTLGEGVNSIGAGAFEGCKLTAVTIPDSVKSISDAAFAGCPLSDIYVSDSNQYYCVVDGVLFNKDMSRLIRYTRSDRTSYFIPESVTIIGSCAFEAVGGLTDLFYSGSEEEWEMIGGQNAGRLYIHYNATGVEEVIRVKDVIETTVDGVKGWYYVVNGNVDLSYTGFAQNKNGWWYVKDGKVTFEENGLMPGTVNGERSWWYLEKSQVIFESLIAQNTTGWWYVKDGKVDFNYTGLAKNGNEWWMFVNGKAKLTFTGFVADFNGNDWYVKDGKIRFDRTGLFQDVGGVLGTKGTWYYVEKNKVVYTAQTVAKNDYGWWYVKNGKMDTSYTGFASNKNGDWYIEKGKVTFKTNNVIKDEQGALGSKGTWYYVVNSKVSYTDGVAKNSKGWWRIKNGKVDFTCNSVEKNEKGWWYIRNGKVDFTYTGIAKNSKGWWRIVNGKVDFTCNSVEKNANGWWRIENGKVNFNFNGIAKNKNGWWYIKGGKVRFDYSGKVKVKGVTYIVKKGKVTNK